MRAIAISLTLFISTAAAVAQQGGGQSAVKTYSSASDVAALQAKAKSERKDNQPLVVEHILQLPPYNANLEYRVAAAPASIHEREAEFFYVIDGSATLITGGKLVNESRTNADNLTGTGIEGGTSRKVAKGDFFVVPENVPHWISSVDGSVTLMSLHAPRTAGGTH
jgi:mannose-6-phosphate isomerase-like protein (cupin superfamily)